MGLYPLQKVVLSACTRAPPLTKRKLVMMQTCMDAGGQQGAEEWQVAAWR